MKVLECSSKGDKRFSAFYARVKVYGKLDSIENHYQLSKRFGTVVPRTWKDAKGKQPTHFCVGNVNFEVEHLTAFYKLLWYKYLRANPPLIDYANQFDDFNDIFKSTKSLNCQADVIRQYIKEGPDSILRDCEEFLALLRKNE